MATRPDGRAAGNVFILDGSDEDESRASGDNESSGSDKDELQASDDDETIRSDDESDDESNDASSVSDLVTRDSSNDDSSDEEEEDDSSEPPDSDEDGDTLYDLDDESGGHDGDALSDSECGATPPIRQEWTAPAWRSRQRTARLRTARTRRPFRVPLLERPFIVKEKCERRPRSRTPGTTTRLTRRATVAQAKAQQEWQSCRRKARPRTVGTARQQTWSSLGRP